MELNKKGLGFAPTIMLIVFIFLTFIGVIIIGVLFFGFEQIDQLLSGIDFNLTNPSGINQSFNQTYQETLGIGIAATLNSLSNLALGLILGMIAVMMIMGFALRSNRLWLVLDIIIIVAAFIGAVYISNSFDTFINSDAQFLDIFSNELQRPSTFLLNLPIYIAIIGVLVMIITYAATRRRGEPVVEFGGA